MALKRRRGGGRGGNGPRSRRCLTELSGLKKAAAAFINRVVRRALGMKARSRRPPLPILVHDGDQHAIHAPTRRCCGHGAASDRMYRGRLPVPRPAASAPTRAYFRQGSRTKLTARRDRERLATITPYATGANHQGLGSTEALIIGDQGTAHDVINVPGRDQGQGSSRSSAPPRGRRVHRAGAARGSAIHDGMPRPLIALQDQASTLEIDIATIEGRADDYLGMVFVDPSPEGPVHPVAQRVRGGHILVALRPRLAGGGGCSSTADSSSGRCPATWTPRPTVASLHGGVTGGWAKTVTSARLSRPGPLRAGHAGRPAVPPAAPGARRSGTGTGPRRSARLADRIEDKPGPAARQGRGRSLARPNERQRCFAASRRNARSRRTKTPSAAKMSTAVFGWRPAGPPRERRPVRPGLTRFIAKLADYHLAGQARATRSTTSRS